MAYNYYPQNYYPQQYPTQNGAFTQHQGVGMVQQNVSNSINWVRGGENGANAYPVAPGRSELLMDADSSVFYIKTVDQSGMPMPLRIFDYTERKSPNAESNPIISDNQADKYILRDEFEKFKTEIKDELKRGVRNPNINSKKFEKEN